MGFVAATRPAQYYFPIAQTMQVVKLICPELLGKGQ